MAGYTDAMAINTKAIVKKNDNSFGLIKRANAGMEVFDARILATVQGNVLTVEIPDKSTQVTCRLQDVMAVISATNKAYLEGQKAPNS